MPSIKTSSSGKPLLTSGSSVKMINGDRITITEYIAEGNMAQVYKARSNYHGEVAFKYLYGKYSTDNSKYYEKCKTLSGFDTPHPDIVWFHCNSVTEYFPDMGDGCFGLTMPLLEGYSGFVKPIKDLSLLTSEQKTDAIMKLADIFEALHRNGLIYGDVSANNAMHRIDRRGKIDVKLCDCDNVTTPNPKHSLGLNGTGWYRAPEVICGGSPTIASDCHALAALAFRILVKGHPLDGSSVRSEALTPETTLKYMGKHPRFVFDGKSNEAPKELRARWDELPEPMQIYFSRMFSQDCLLLKEERPGAAILKKAIQISY